MTLFSVRFGTEILRFVTKVNNSTTGIINGVNTQIIDRQGIL